MYKTAAARLEWSISVDMNSHLITVVESERGHEAGAGEWAVLL